MPRLSFLITLILMVSGCQLLQFAEYSVQDAQKKQVLITVSAPESNEVSLARTFSNLYRPLGYPAAPSVLKAVRDIARENALIESDGWRIESLNIYCARLQLTSGQDVDAILKQLRADPRVESAQAVVRFQTLTVVNRQPRQSYNDPYFELQYKENAAKIREMHHWATGKNIDIAVIDTGADVKHPDIEQRVRRYQNFVDNNMKSFRSDIHGTAVSGIIVAEANNKRGIVGVAPDAHIWPLKACWQPDRFSSRAECDSFTVASALDFAIDQNVDIINLSLAGPPDALIGRLIGAATERGMVVVAADPGPGKDRFPAMLPKVIAVSHRPEQKTQNQKAISGKPFKLQLVGKSMLTTGPGGVYDYFSGPSMTTAMVSGYVALYFEKQRNVTFDQLTRFLQKTLHPPQTIGENKNQSGARVADSNLHPAN